MKLLAVDTSTDACSCAVFLDGELFERFELAPRRHAQLLLGMVDACLKEANVELSSMDALAFGRGPGSFTGVRVAASTIQAFAFGKGLPVVPVSSLAALAQRVHEAHGGSKIAAALDARMNEVYWGVFRAGDNGMVIEDQPERVCAPESLPPLDGENWIGAGCGWRVYQARLHTRFPNQVSDVVSDAFPTAGSVAKLGAEKFSRGEYVSAEAALPVYLRDQVTRV